MVYTSDVRNKYRTPSTCPPNVCLLSVLARLHTARARAYVCMYIISPWLKFPRMLNRFCTKEIFTLALPSRAQKTSAPSGEAFALAPSASPVVSRDPASTDRDQRIRNQTYVIVSHSALRHPKNSRQTHQSRQNERRRFLYEIPLKFFQEEAICSRILSTRTCLRLPVKLPLSVSG